MTESDGRTDRKSADPDAQRSDGGLRGAATGLLGRVATVRDDALDRPVHGDRTAAILGIALGVSFTICFLTGLYSHLLQQPPTWISVPPAPAGLFRITQGLHVATGIASIPLLLAKLWSVYPRLFAWPPFKDLAQAIERLALVVLVAGSLFMLFSGTANIERWYPWKFFFPAGHYWAAWITIGALVVHIGAKLPVVRRVLRSPVDPTPADPGSGLTPARVPRRRRRRLRSAHPHDGRSDGRAARPLRLLRSPPTRRRPPGPPRQPERRRRRRRRGRPGR